MDTLFPSINKDDDKSLTDSELFMPTFHSVEYNIDQILAKIKNINSFNEDEIKDIIVRQYHTILNYDQFLNPERKYALELFTNEKFLKVLISIIGMLDLSTDEIVCINKITYDYYTLSDKDENISYLLMELSYYVNNKTAIRLSAIVGIQGARVLAMISKSSFKIEKNVRRVNRFIIKSNIALSVQDIINIYCTLYDRFTYPIIYTMLDTHTEGFSDIEYTRYQAISSVVLRLLNAMTSKDIYKVLSNYAYILQLTNVGDNTRFSIREACIKNNLGRILKVVDQIMYETEDNPVCL